MKEKEKDGRKITKKERKSSQSSKGLSVNHLKRERPYWLPKKGRPRSIKWSPQKKAIRMLGHSS